MCNKAVLVIDMQLGVFMRKEYDGMEIYKESELLEAVSSVITNARNNNIPVIYIQHMYEDLPIMEKGQPFWNVHPAIAPLDNESIIEKYHADAFFDSKLEETLQRHNITTLIITGVQTAYCVDTTCRRAHSMGYNCILAEDGHSTLDSDFLPAEKIVAHHNEVLGSQFADVVKSREIIF